MQLTFFPVGAAKITPDTPRKYYTSLDTHKQFDVALQIHLFICYLYSKVIYLFHSLPLFGLVQKLRHLTFVT